MNLDPGGLHFTTTRTYMYSDNGPMDHIAAGAWSARVSVGTPCLILSSVSSRGVGPLSEYVLEEVLVMCNTEVGHRIGWIVTSSFE